MYDTPDQKSREVKLCVNLGGLTPDWMLYIALPLFCVYNRSTEVTETNGAS